MQVRFWGVRGSIAVSGGAFSGTGGNTSCVEVVHEGHRIVLDGGTGLQELGRSLATPDVETSLLFSHVHWDHIQGVPYFAPAFDPGARLRLVGAPGLKRALVQQMRAPMFPIGLDAFRADLAFHELPPDTEARIGPFTVRSTEGSHPNGVRVWRIEAGGRAVVYATDVEHGDAVDPVLVDLASGADLLVHDAQYTDREYPGRRGWGHSTWEQAVEVAERAQVGQLALFHHDPTRTDAALAEIESWAARRRRGTFAA
ncbi:MAG: MBL fold metallo-hydrolase, partial [Myxococcota bacterium]